MGMDFGPILPGAGTSIDYTSIVNLLQGKKPGKKKKLPGLSPGQ